MVPVENNYCQDCWDCTLHFTYTLEWVSVFYHVWSTLSEVCWATERSSTFRLSACFNIAVTHWCSWHQAASPLLIRQPGGWRCATSGDGHLRVCCLQLLDSLFCWRSSGQHFNSQISCCSSVLHWAARAWPLLTQPWRGAWGGRVQPGSLLWLWRRTLMSCMLFLNLLEVVKGH